MTDEISHTLLKMALVETIADHQSSFAGVRVDRRIGVEITLWVKVVMKMDGRCKSDL
jgi:hypothetical protein